MTRISDTAARNFLDFQRKLKPALDAIGVKQNFVYEGIGMSKTTWQRRLKDNSFTVHEILDICQLLNKR